MTISILSYRGIESNVSHDPVFELEDILVKTCNAQMLVPRLQGAVRWAEQQPTLIKKISGKLIRQTIGFYQLSEPLARSSNECNVLIMIALNGSALEMLSSIPRWRQQFDIVAAYVFDSWLFECYPKYASELDHVFVPMPEIIEPLRAFLQVPVSLLPFASDVLTHGSGEADRPIDLMSYGRIPDAFEQAFSDRFNKPDSKHIYYRSTPRQGQRFPQQLSPTDRETQHEMQLYNLLRRSKLSIAFDTLYPGMRQFPFSFVTLRWFQSGAAGCGIVGKRPTTPLADELLDWQDATIELPDDPEASVDFIERLLSNPSRLLPIYQRNYLESLTRHDWRYRIEQMLTTLGVDLPDPLVNELRQIKLQAKAAKERLSAIL